MAGTCRKSIRCGIRCNGCPICSEVQAADFIRGECGHKRSRLLQCCEPVLFQALKIQRLSQLESVEIRLAMGSVSAGMVQQEVGSEAGVFSTCRPSHRPE